nr:unnamed protein product [Digitaria exilis]
MNAVLVEKILRVQPGVKKLYLLVRAQDNTAAQHRVLKEVVGQELFRTLRKIHGDKFRSFIQEKISPVAGDIIHEDLGIESPQVKQLSEEIDIIVNGAAITNFYERYDVALASNALGTKRICQFAKQCVHLKMLLHVSTAYVLTGEQKGLLPEKPIQMGETPKPDCHLDIEAELETIDIVIDAYDKQTIPCFICDHNSTVDAIPGDMVVNAAMVAIAAHYAEETQIIYHVTSAHKNPLQMYLLEELAYGYFFVNPRVREGKRTIQHKRLLLFTRYLYFHAYMVLAYKIPLQMLYLVNLLLGGLFSEFHNKLNRNYNFFMLLAKLYAPFTTFKACFDNTNLRKLWRMTGACQGDGYIFNFDPNCVNWSLYLFNTHIPAALKISRGKKDGIA